ncbi:MAG: hypothetical protein KAH86_02315 [Methanosarcinales archaeon]|nr:hypothetical protein [Methanosarcinales archaeon]
MRIDKAKLYERLHEYFSKHGVNTFEMPIISNEVSEEECTSAVDTLAEGLVDAYKNNVQKEIVNIFSDCENPEIPYFEVVMDIMQFANDFVGHPHIVELVFARINSAVARRKLEIEEHKYFTDEEWTPELAEAAMQTLRDKGTERDYRYMIDMLFDTLSHASDKEAQDYVKMKLNGIIKKHSKHEINLIYARMQNDTMPEQA